MRNGELRAGCHVGLPHSDRTYTVVRVGEDVVRIERDSGLQQSVRRADVHCLERPKEDRRG